RNHVNTIWKGLPYSFGVGWCADVPSSRAEPMNPTRPHPSDAPEPRVAWGSRVRGNEGDSVSRAPIGAFEATVLAVEDLSPSFRRVTFGGAGLQDFGPGAHPRDLRIKLVIPPAGAAEPHF